jgi:NADPH:quinone reductase-like Zn-dependent oxidoreductase
VKAVVLTRFGPPEVLQLQEVATPVPREHEVLIRIYATTVTAGECEIRGLKVPLALRLPLRLYMSRMRRGPVLLGQELAGEIAAAGPAVTRFGVGDAVVGWAGLRLGTDTEYICLPANGVLARKPPSLTYEEAAALPVGGLDALHLLRRATIQPGERVLISGAGGTIGTFAVQIARSMGAVVTAVDSGDKLAMQRGLGASRVIDYTREDFTRSGATYDVIFDVIGKTPFARCVRMLTPQGRYLIANPRLSYRLQARWTRLGAGQRVLFWASRSASEYQADFQCLSELIEAGQVRTVIDRCYPLEQLAEAHRYVESGRKQGHVVITVQPPGGAT